MSLEVIGAGTGRTGTTSLKLALEQLGFSRCYHMVELLEHPEDVAYWERANRGKPVDWDALFAGYRATVDYPGYVHYKALMQRYPEAKVILSVRDPEAWYESALATIYRAGPGLAQKLKMGLLLPFSPKLRKLLRVFKMVGQLWAGRFEGRFEDKAFAVAKFREHNEEVKRTVPADRLLIYEVREGWEPLCEFLGVPVPNTPFPRSNDRQAFQDQQKQGLRALLKGEIA